jgi:hypothetical protein
VYKKVVKELFREYLESVWWCKWIKQAPGVFKPPGAL